MVFLTPPQVKALNSLGDYDSLCIELHPEAPGHISVTTWKLGRQPMQVKISPTGKKTNE